MEHPNTDSENNEELPEQTHTDENSTAAETAAETHTEQPAEESEKKDSPQNSGLDEGLKKLRERLGIPTEKEKPEINQSKKETTEKKEDATETEDEESGDDMPEEIELENGNKLVAVKVDGIIVHTTPDKAEEVKKGLLRQSDYTKKTQALSEEAKRIESERSLLIRQINEHRAYQEELALSGPFSDPEPLESEYVDQFADDDEKREQIQKFREDKQKWLNAREDHLGRKAEYSTRKKTIEAENNANAENFIKEYGNEAFETIYPDLMEIRAALNTTGTKPFPKEMLKIYYRGKNFDALVKAEVEKAKKTLIEKVDKNVKKSGTIRQVGTGGVTKTGDRYDAALEKIKQRGGGGW